jgi:hypothetical protein
MYAKSLAALATLVAAVAAHGYVDNITIAGITYTGYQVHHNISQ